MSRPFDAAATTLHLGGHKTATDKADLSVIAKSFELMPWSATRLAMQHGAEPMTTIKNTCSPKASTALAASTKPPNRQKRRANDEQERQQRTVSHRRLQGEAGSARELQSPGASASGLEPTSQAYSPGSHWTGVHHDMPKHPLVQIAARTRRAIRYQCRSDGGSSYSPRRRWLQDAARANLRSLRRLKSITDPLDFQLAVNDHMLAYANRIVAATHQVSREYPLPVPASKLAEIAEAARANTMIVPTLAIHEQFGRKRRSTYGYGISDKVRQLMLADIIRYVGPQPHNDFAAPGAGGRDAHIRHVRNLNRRGFCHCAVSDISDAYNSVRPDHIAELIPLPSSALENILFAGEPEGDGWGGDDTYDDEGSHLMAPPGLPQGSICSGPALSMVVGNVLRSLTEDAWDLSHYVDDIVICAQSHSEMEQLQLRLEEELLGLTGGGLRLHKTQFADFSRGESIDLLGYRLSPSSSGELYVRPSPQGWAKAEDECYSKLSGALKQAGGLSHSALFEKAHDYFMGWASSHGEWVPQWDQDKRFIAGRRASEVHELFCDEHEIAAPWE